MNEQFEDLFDKAAEIHGHKCPSLFYGITLGLLAKEMADSSTKEIVLEGSSKCIRDGVNTVLQDSPLCDKVSIITDSSGCGVTIKGNEVQQSFSIPQKVRQQINQWNEELPLEEFQIQGLNYLRSLTEDELICEK